MGGWQDTWLDRLLDVALSPALWLSVSLALGCGLLFYLGRGGGWRQAGRDVGAALAGFAVGQAAGMALGWAVLRLGDVQVLWGMLGALAGLVTGRSLLRRRLAAKKAQTVARLAPPRPGGQG